MSGAFRLSLASCGTIEHGQGKGGLHGRARLPGGTVLARFHAADPSVDCGSLDVLVGAPSRREAVTKAKGCGLHGVHLRTNPLPPTNADVEQLLGRSSDILWRR
jgi:hypothetical protein